MPLSDLRKVLLDTSLDKYGRVDSNVRSREALTEEDILKEIKSVGNSNDIDISTR